MKRKIFAGILALSMFLIPTARAEEVDPLIKDYIPRIESGEIKPPQYEIKDDNGDGIDDDLGIRRDSPKPKEWIESLKSQKFGGNLILF